MIHRVELSRQARKDLKKVPRHILGKFRAWVESVETDGLEETRKIPGFHDEALRGKRAEQRSIRLSRAYRAIYEIQQDGSVSLVMVEEVNKHEY